METVRRDLHSTTATVSSLLTRYSKLAAQASTSYSSSGTLAEDITRRKDELETELNGSLEVVRARPALWTVVLWPELASERAEALRSATPTSANG